MSYGDMQLWSCACCIRRLTSADSPWCISSGNWQSTLPPAPAQRLAWQGVRYRRGRWLTQSPPTPPHPTTPYLLHTHTHHQSRREYSENTRHYGSRYERCSGASPRGQPAASCLCARGAHKRGVQRRRQVSRGSHGGDAAGPHCCPLPQTDLTPFPQTLRGQG